MKYCEKIKSYTKLDDNGCWVWTGWVHPKRNQPMLVVGKGKRINARNAAFDNFIGLMDEGYIAVNTCGNNMCVNPDHLITEYLPKQRAKKLIVTQCKRGHDFDDENTLITSGRKKCRACCRIHAENRKAKLNVEKGNSSIKERSNAGQQRGRTTVPK